MMKGRNEKIKRIAETTEGKRMEKECNEEWQENQREVRTEVMLFRKV